MADLGWTTACRRSLRTKALSSLTGSAILRKASKPLCRGTLAKVRLADASLLTKPPIKAQSCWLMASALGGSSMMPSYSRQDKISVVRSSAHWKSLSSSGVRPDK